MSVLLLRTTDLLTHLNDTNLEIILFGTGIKPEGEL